MVALADLQPASFRGARFLVPRDTMSEGPNSVHHKFPGQGIKTSLVEDNGQNTGEFDLHCVLHGPTLSADWARLRSALNQGGSGTLVHPWLGRKQCAVKGPFKVHREDSESGILKIEVCFLETAPAAPSIGVLFPATVSFIADSAISDAFAVPLVLPISPFSLAYIFGAVGSFVNTVLGAFASVAGVATAAAAILAAPLQLTLLAPTLIALFRAPFDDTAVSNLALALGYGAVFAELMVLLETNDAIDPTTEDLIERQAAADQILVSSMSACFAALCDAMAAKSQGGDYSTATDVENDVSTLSINWSFLSERSIDPDLRAKLMDLYARVSGILQNLEVVLPKIVSMEVPAVPVSVLSYWLYDTDAKEDVLAGLNPDLPPWLYDGNASVLSQ